MDKVRVVVGVGLLAALLYWLYPKSDNATGKAATEITIWFNGPIEGRQLDAVDAFQRRFPQYRVVLGSSAARTGLDGEGNPQRLMCGIAGGVPPDVVEYDRFAICQWAGRGAFLDLNPLIERDLKRSPATSGPNDAYIVRPDDYVKQTWEECQFQGGQYGVPNYMDDRALYFNEDLLIQGGFADAAGKGVPPKTWEQVLRKRVDVKDASIRGMKIHSDTADFEKAGVRAGDTLSHVSDKGLVTRCLVERVDGPHDLTVKSPYPRRAISLPDKQGQQIKVFDQDGYALKLSRWDDDGRLKVIGFEPQQGNAWLYFYGWANGGRFLSPDGLKCEMNDPRIVEALQWTTDLYDAMGGADEVNAFKKGFQNFGAQDPFIINQIAMFINGDWFMRDLVRFRRDMHFGTAPPPVPEREAQAGRDKCTWVAGFAYCIPKTCPPEKLEAAWTLVKFLASPEGGMIMNEHDAQRQRGQGRLYMPRLMANKQLNAEQMKRYIDIPEMPPRARAAMQTHIDLLPYAFCRPVSPLGQLLWNAQADAQDIAWSHAMTPQAALDFQNARVQRGLDAFFKKPAGRTPVNWTLLVWCYLGLIAAVAAALWFRHVQRNQARGFYRREWRAGVLFALPWLLGFLVFSGGPMIFSAVMSLTEYDVIRPAEYVGIGNFREMFTVDWGGPDAEGKERVPTGVRRTLLNTTYMAIGLPLGMVVGLGLAMLLDARVVGLKYYRTLFFLPAIMPVVAASILWIWVFNAQYGLLNWLLRAVGIEALIDWLHGHDLFPLRAPISWLTNRFTSKPALIIMGLWSAGSSMIIWLAGLKEIPTQLYEAAALDGAGAIRRFFRVTLPMLSPYILFNLIIGLIQTFQIFTQAYIMTPNGYPERSTYFYVYKLFDECFSFFRLGYGAAMAWVLFVIVIVLTLINMRISKRWVHYAGD